MTVALPVILTFVIKMENSSLNSRTRFNLYDEIVNLNLLLAKAHAQTIATIQKNVACTLAVVDQFGNDALVPAALHEMNCHISLEQRPRAEDDIAVAATSIIARVEFVQQIEALSNPFSPVICSSWLTLFVA